MAIQNGKKTTGLPGIHLIARDSYRDALIQFDAVNTAPTTTTGLYYLYANSSGELVFNNGSVVTVIGAAGTVSTGTWDGIYATDKTLTVSTTTFTIDGTHASNNVLTLTSTGAGSGHVVQITNVGTGKDINGTSNTWSISKVGDIVGNLLTLSGDADTTSFTLTAGDMVSSDGSFSLTNADDENTFLVTNNGNTSTSQVKFAGSGAFTGNTTSSFFTVTPSGLTTGTAIYLPVAALTTGKALHIVANAVTDGLVLNITSSSTVHTATGRLLNIASTAATNTSAVLNEIATAANDETVLLRLTASDVLAAGKILHISASAMTTGTAIDAAALDALTTGVGVSLASTSTTTTSGSLLRVSTGTTDAVATNGIVSITATAAYTSTSNCGLVQVVANSITTGATIMNISGTAMTTSVGLRVISSGTGLTSGSLALFSSGTTGAIATNGAVSIQATGDFTSTSNQGFLGVIANSTLAGTIASISGTGLTTGVGLRLVNGTSAMTTGSLLRVDAGGTGAIATNGIVSFTHSGDFTSTSAVNGGFVEVKGNSSTAGTIVNVVGSGLTTGIALQLSNGTSGMTSGSLLRVTASGTGTVATNGIVSITHGGIFVSTSNAGVLDVRATAMVGTASNGTLVNFMTTAAAQVDTTVLNVENSGFTTGFTGSMLRIKSPTTTGACKVVDLLADGITSGGTAMDISTDALTTGIALNIANSGGAMTTGSLLRVAAQGTGAIATNGVVSFTHTGAFTSNSAVDGGFVEVKGNSTTAGTIVNIVGAALTTGIALQLSNGTSGMTSGSLVRVTASGTGAIATNGIVSISHGGVFTSTSNAGVLDVAATATTAGTVVHITSTAAGQTTAQLLNVTASGYTASYTGNVVSFVGCSTTGSGNVLSITSVNTTDGTGILVTANSLTTGSAVRVTSSGTITSSSEGLLNLVATGMTSGSALKIDLTEGTLNGGKYINCFDDTGGTSVWSVGENGAVLYSDFTEVVAATNVITAAESGSVFFLNHATEFVSTLPAVQAGLHFTFIVTAAPSGANYTIVTDSSSNVIIGTVHSSDGVDGDSELVGCDTINFVSAAAVVGDQVEVWCDGTNWFAKAFCDVSTGITFTTVA